MRFKPDDIYVYPSSRNAWNVEKHFYWDTDFKLPTNVNRIFYPKNELFLLDICSNPAYYEKLLNYGLVSKETVKSALESLNQSNISLRHDKLFRVGFEVGNRLLNR
jgi:hypothetical protein